MESSFLEPLLTSFSDDTSNFHSFKSEYKSNMDLASPSDLEAHFNAHFYRELEYGRSSKSNISYGKNDVSDFENDSIVKVFENSSWLSDNKHLTKDSNQSTNKDYYNDFELINNLNSNNLKYYNCCSNFNEITFNKSHKNESLTAKDSNAIVDFEVTNEVIDDSNESLIENLAGSDESDNCDFSPDYLTDEFLDILMDKKTGTSLPPIGKAFSKHQSFAANLSEETYSNDLDDFDNENEVESTFINNLDKYSYPNNVLNNFKEEKSHQCEHYSVNGTLIIENNLDHDNRRTISLCESTESDVCSTNELFDELDEVYYEENSEGIVVNLEEFGLYLEESEEPKYEANTKTVSRKNSNRNKNNKKFDAEIIYGDRMCCWENCEEIYPSQGTLVEHIEKVHVNSYKGEEFSCLWRACSRERRPFNARYKLLIHMRVHSGHKPNRCTHPGCGKAFSRLENLKIHRRSHTGERPYRCTAPGCRKAFSNSSDRAKHQRTHFNARPYACQLAGCSKRYTDPSSLRKHVKNHAIVHARPAMPNSTNEQYHRTDKLKCLQDSAPFATSKIANGSPVKMDTLKSIRNKLNEQSTKMAAKDGGKTVKCQLQVSDSWDVFNTMILM